MAAMYWDEEKGLFVAGDPARMTAQQRANWKLLRAIMEAEYQRGFANGRVCGLDEAVDAQLEEAAAALDTEAAQRAGRVSANNP